MLVFPDITKPLQIEADASGHATGAILSMLCKDCKDDKWRPCAYLSKSLKDVECNYDIHDKEILAIRMVTLS
jgi:hypothetical protein